MGLPIAIPKRPDTVLDIYDSATPDDLLNASGQEDLAQYTYSIKYPPVAGQRIRPRNPERDSFLRGGELFKNFTNREQPE